VVIVFTYFLEFSEVFGKPVESLFPVSRLLLDQAIGPLD